MTPAATSTARRRPRSLREIVAQLPAVTPELVAAYRPQAASLSARITARIQLEVSAFALVDDPRIHQVISEAITSAVDLFVDALAGAPSRGTKVEEFYRGLGRAEALGGHDLDGMRAAHHIATQESWEDLRRATAELGQPADVIGQLGDALLAYQTRLLEQAVLGFMEVRTNAHRAREDARAGLVAALLSGVGEAQVERTAARCSWPVPERIVVASTRADPQAISIAGSTHQALAGVQHGRLILIADPQTIERLARSIGRIGGSPVAVSWAVLPQQTRHAARWADRALHLAAQHIIPVPAHGIVWCRDHQANLCLHADPTLRRHADEHLLAPLLVEKPSRRVALADTMLLWLQTRQSAPALSQALGVHEQTIRNRLRYVKKLFGDRLADPTEISGLLTALESATPRWRDEA